MPGLTDTNLRIHTLADPAKLIEISRDHEEFSIRLLTEEGDEITAKFDPYWALKIAQWLMANTNLDRDVLRLRI
jgi:hypothetical protein